MEPNLEVRIGSLRLRNPLILASGVVGHNTNLLLKAWDMGAGALVTKTFTYEPRSGYVTPTIVELPYGYINAVGLENPGIEKIGEVLQKLKDRGAIVIVSIAGRNVEEFIGLAKKAVESGADAIELNLSCPHAGEYGYRQGIDRDFVVKVIRGVRDEVDVPILPKFGVAPNLVDIVKISEFSGADGVVLINTIRAMKIDVWIKKPVLSNKYGGLSGPAIHPIAVACVYSVYEATDIPIVASGGVWGWEDVVEFMLAGANAVQVGSVLGRVGMEVFSEILEGIKRYLRKNSIRDVTEIIGLAHD